MAETKEAGARRAIGAVDRAQQRHPVLGFPIAVFKKFGDDQAGSLATLIAYYGFFSLFPLLLVLVSGLGIVLAGHPALRTRILDTALAQFPVIGPQIASDVHGLTGSWVSVALGSIGAVWAGLGVAQTAEAAMNAVWEVPRSERPSFVHRRLRALLMLVVLGSIVLASTFVSGVGSAGVLPSWLAAVAGWTLSFALNLLLFMLTYRVLTARALTWRNVAPGAAVAALAWTALQAAGGYYVTHQIRSASEVYGTFALVIGLLVWISLGAQVALIGAEVNVVKNRRLWPRTLVQPPLNEADEEVYRSIVRRARIRPEVNVRVWFGRRKPPPES